MEMEYSVSAAIEWFEAGLIRTHFVEPLTPEATLLKRWVDLILGSPSLEKTAIEDALYKTRKEGALAQLTSEK